MRPSLFSELIVADPGEGPGGPGHPLFLDQTEAQKIFWGRPVPALSKGLDDRGPPLSQGLGPSLFKTCCFAY